MAIRASRPVVERAISAFLTFFTGIFLFAWGSSLGALPAHAQTTLSGNVFGNLDASGNPYVTSGFTIPAGQTLTVGEGVIIKLRSAGSIAVNGLLVVNGSAAQPAYLTSIKDDAVGGDSNLDGAGSTPFAYDWQEISVPTGGSVEMTNAVIRYGGFGFNGVPFNCIRVSGGTVTVGSSTITYCGNRAVSMTGGAVSLVDVDFSHAAIGVEQSGGTLNVLDSIFKDASTAGIRQTESSTVLLNSDFEKISMA